MEIQNVFLRYLLAPLAIVVTTVVMTIFNKKNKILTNRRLIATLLLSCIVLAIPGIFGLIGFYFMPWGYVFSQVYALLIGVLLVFLCTKYCDDMFTERKWFVLFGSLSIVGFSMCLYKLIFDWLSVIEMGWWASTSLFTMLIPIFFWWAYISLLSIPLEIYKLWEYPLHSEDINLDHLDFDKLLVLELELYKDLKEQEPLKVKVKAPNNIYFGVWFQKFIDDYNMKFPSSNVVYKDKNGEAYKWMFFVKTKFYKRNLYIDPELEIEKNAITEKMTIHAKRVAENRSVN